MCGAEPLETKQEIHAHLEGGGLHSASMGVCFTGRTGFQDHPMAVVPGTVSPRSESLVAEVSPNTVKDTVNISEAQTQSSANLCVPCSLHCLACFTQSTKHNPLPFSG